MGVGYNPKQNGTVQGYIRKCREERVPICFKGAAQFQMLVDLGLVIPHMTFVRLMYNLGRGDEAYQVVDGFRLEGLEIAVHGGQSGIHDAKKILSRKAPYFEVSGLRIPDLEHS